jgi:hypothetical protein
MGDIEKGSWGTDDDGIEGVHAVELSVHEQRLAICGDCEFQKTMAIIGRYCEKCGCILKAKTKLKWTKCPIGKW